MEDADIIRFYGQEALDLLNQYYRPEIKGTLEQVRIENELTGFYLFIDKDEEWTPEAPLFAFYGFCGELVRTI